MYGPLLCYKCCFAGVDVAPDQGAEKCSSGKQRSRESKQPFYVDSMWGGGGGKRVWAWIINQSKKIEMITNPISPEFQILEVSQDRPIAIFWLFGAFSLLLSVKALCRFENV